MVFFSKKNTDNISVRFIIEIVGKPKEHVAETMELVVKKMKEENERWIVHSDSISPTEQKEQYFHSFSTVEIEFKNFDNIIAYCFEHLPSSAEILTPDSFSMSMQQLNGLLNDFIDRMHQTDMIAKKLRADNEILQRNSTQIFRNFLRFSLESGSKDTPELARITGIPSADIEKFIEPFIKEGWIVVKSGRYTIAQ